MDYPTVMCCFNPQVIKHTKPSTGAEIPHLSLTLPEKNISVYSRVQPENCNSKPGLVSYFS